MTFDEWIKAEDISYDEAARRIRVANAKVAWRYAKGRQIPRRDIMTRIAKATAGKVRPEDFYGVANGEAAE